MYRGDGVEDDGAVPRQHLELLLGHDVPEVEQRQLHLPHVDVQVSDGVLVDGGRGLGAPRRVLVPRRPRRGGRGRPRGRPAATAAASAAAAAAAAWGTHLGELLQEVLLEGARTTR